MLFILLIKLMFFDNYSGFNPKYYKELIKDVIQVYNFRMEYSDSFFNKAVYLNKESLVNIIIENSFVENINMKNAIGITPIQYSSCDSMNLNLTKKLLNNGANPFYKDSWFFRTAFSCMIENNWLDLVKDTISKNRNYKSNFTNEKLRDMIATDVFLHNQWSFDLYDIGEGKSDYYYAVSTKSKDVFDYFIENSIFLINEELDSNGITPLLIAIKSFDLEMIKYVLNIGGDVRVRDKYNFNALSYLLYYSSIINHDIHENVEVNRDGYSRIVIEIIEILLLYGCSICDLDNSINRLNLKSTYFLDDVKKYINDICKNHID